MNTDVLNLAFDEFGDSQNPPLIILHGFFASARNWRTVARILAENFHVWVPDLRNHGASSHSATMDYPSMAADLEFFIEQHQLNRPHIMGHSMGGKVAMYFALQHPQVLDKLIVVDISPTAYKHSFSQTIQALKSIPLEKISNRKQADDYLAETIQEASYRQFLLQNLQLQDGQYRWRVDLDIFEQNADNIVGFPELDENIKYPNKALFIGGGESDYIKTDDVYRYFPKADIKTIPGAAHWVHVQAQHEFCNLVNDFLASA